jgi:hypothetical protein
MSEPTATDLARWEKWRDLRARQAEANEEELLMLAVEEEVLREEGLKEVLDKDLNSDYRWFWLSFADDSGFLGVAIVQAGGIVEATRTARTLDCNPGGEVRAYPIDIERVPEQYRNRLLSEQELQDAGLL